MISIDNNSNNVNKNMEEKQVKKDEVKLLMKQNQVKQWEVAEAMGISELQMAQEGLEGETA